jgi:hypothetical protein
MGEWPAIDSRHYIVAFELRSEDDCPSDFELPSSLTSFDASLFLPRDPPDWFGRSLYPPRILVLKGSALYVVSHPSTGEPPCRCICSIRSRAQCRSEIGSRRTHSPSGPDWRFRVANPDRVRELVGPPKARGRVRGGAGYSEEAQ